MEHVIYISTPKTCVQKHTFKYGKQQECEVFVNNISVCYTFDANGNTYFMLESLHIRSKEELVNNCFNLKDVFIMNAQTKLDNISK